ncbi:MAG: helix-turn-helix domain-containing protein [Martelella sp.]|uniref:helix-turn-helix domain-containing protein n=1 Tax=Martelella sp. TaxID=1969699 RepID=UPI003241BBF0
MSVSCQTITLATCDAYLVPPHLIYTRRRTKAFVEPRHVSWKLAQDMTHRSLPEIGRLMGGYDHTSVLHGCRKIRDRMKEDAALRERYDSLRRVILKSIEQNEQVNWPEPKDWVLETAMILANDTGEPEPMAGAVAQAMVVGLMHYFARTRSLERANAELHDRLSELRDAMALKPLADELDYQRMAAAARVAAAWQRHQTRRFTTFEKASQSELEDALKSLSPLFAKTGEHV